MNLVKEKIWNRTSGQMYDQIQYCVSQQVWDQAWDKIRRLVYDQVNTEIWSSIWELGREQAMNNEIS